MIEEEKMFFRWKREEGGSAKKFLVGGSKSFLDGSLCYKEGPLQLEARKQ